MFSLELGRAVAKLPALANGDVVLRPAALSDYSSWRRLRDDSRAHLTRWEPDWRDDEASFAGFKTRLRFQERQHRTGAGLFLFVLLRATDELIGGVSLCDMQRHSARSATLGYWIGAPYLRRGYGLMSVNAVLRHAFATLRLNRVEAACQPGNVASRALLAKAGFREEGLARDYLFINGAWRDHVLFALTARDYCGAPPAGEDISVLNQENQ
jgi:ribosomal-protein-alanine N-acetyltransferase